MRLELSARARALLRRFPRTNLYSVGELVLLAILAVQCARLVWVVMTPVTPLGDWRPAHAGVAGDPAAILRGFDPFFRLAATNAAPSAVTSLQLTLFGTRVDEATGGGSAIIATPDGMQKSYAVGDEIISGATLKAVAFDHVSIDHGGAVEQLYMDQSTAVTPVEPPAVPADLAAAAAVPQVSVQDLNAGGITIDQLKQGVAFIPRIDNGKVTGLVVRPSGDGSIFDRAGLKQGDVVTEIMGKPVTAAGDLGAYGDKLKSGGILSLMVERDGKAIPIGVNVTGS